MVDRSVRALLMAGVATVALAGPSTAQDNIGVTAAVNPQAQGTPPERSTRTLNVGLDMFKNERVVTGPEGKTQLLFIDGSALSIGPNSDVVLDEFVYDPATGDGKLAMTATKGVFRLVGGKLSKTEAVTLKTPTATIGIRGGVGTVVLPAPGGPPPFVSLDFGKALTVTGQSDVGQPVNFMVTRSGTGVVFGPGGTLLPPGPIPQEMMAAALNSVEGSRGSSGGARERPTDSRVQQAGVGQQGSSLPPDAIRAAEAIAADISNVSTEVADVTNLDQASAIGFSDLNSSSSGTGQSFLLSGRYKTTPGSGNARGPGDSSTAFNRVLFGDILGSMFTGITLDLSNFAESTFDNDFTAPVTGTLVETLSRGKFYTFTSSGTTSPFGPISGRVFVSNLNDFVFFANKEENFSSGLERSIAFAGMPTPATILQPGFGILTFRLEQDAIMATNLAFLMAAGGGNLPGTRSPVFITPSTSVDPSFLQANLAINGQGTGQVSAASVGVGRLVGSLLGTNVNLDGRARGSARLSSTGAASFISGPIGFSTDALGNGVFGSDGPNFAVLESSQVSVISNVSGSFADFQSASVPVPVGLTQSAGSTLADTVYFPTNLAIRIDNPAGVGTSRQTRTLGGFANGFIDTFNSSGVFGGTFIHPFVSSGSSFSLSTNASLGTVSGAFNGAASSINFNLPFGGSTIDGRSAFVDDKLYAAVESSSGGLRQGVTPTQFQMYVVGNELVSTTNFLPSGVSYCNCTSTWGYWGMDVIHAAGRDRIHLGQYVAGVVPTAGQIPTSASANYTGHAVADIMTAGGARYKAAGTFGLSYTFGSTFGSGSWSITNFDGGTLNGSVSAGGSSPTFSGSINSGTSTNGLGLVTGGSINGTFLSAGGNPVREVATSFVADGMTGGRAVGITLGTQ